MQAEDLELELERRRTAAAARSSFRASAGLTCATLFILFSTLLRRWSEIVGTTDSYNSMWHYPALIECLRDLRRGQLPLWSPKFMLGYPLWAAECRLLLHPAAILTSWMSSTAMIHAVALANCMGAFAAFYFFAGSRKMGRPASILGAAVYAGNSFVFAHSMSGNHDVGTAIALLPLFVFVFTLPQGECHWWQWPSAALLAIASGILCGPYLLFISLCAAVASKLLLGHTGTKWSVCVFAILVYMIGWCGSAFTSFPASELLGRSQLPLPHSKAPFFVPFSNWISGFVPRVFGGGKDVPYWGNGDPSEVIFYSGFLLPPLIIGAWRQFYSREKVLVRRALLSAAALFVLSSFIHLFPFNLLAGDFSEIDILEPARLLLPVVFIAAWISAFCFRVFLRERVLLTGRFIKIFAVFFAAFVLVAGAMALLPKNAHNGLFKWYYGNSAIYSFAQQGYEISEHFDWTTAAPDGVTDELSAAAFEHLYNVFGEQAIFCVLAILILVISRRAKAGSAVPAAAIILLAALDLRIGAGGLCDTTSVSTMRPPLLMRDKLKGKNPVRIAMPESYETRNSVVIGGNTASEITAPRLLTNVQSAFAACPLLSPQTDLRGAPEWAVHYLTFSQIEFIYFPSSSRIGRNVYPINLIAQDPDGKLAQVMFPAARVRAVPQIEPVSGPESAVSRTVVERFPGETRAVVSSQISYPELEYGAANFNQTSEIVNEGTDWIEIRCNCAAAALLVLADTWYPGWHALSNHFPAPVIEANAFMRGVPVPAGSSFVEMRYLPFSVRLGGFVSFSAICIVIIWAGSKYFAFKAGSYKWNTFAAKEVTGGQRSA
jgi:hypothetical protein